MYLTWMLSFYSVKFFAPPAADFNRSGYPGILPPDELATYDANNPSAADPWFVQGTVSLSVVGETALGILTVSTSVNVAITGVGAIGHADAPAGGAGVSCPSVHITSHIGTLTVTATAIVHPSGIGAHGHLGSVGSGVPLLVAISGVQTTSHVASVTVVNTP
jgi:hypothetical protein